MTFRAAMRIAPVAIEHVERTTGRHAHVPRTTATLLSGARYGCTKLQVTVSITHPAEFIELTFTQQMRVVS